MSKANEALSRREGWGVSRVQDPGAHYYRASGTSLCGKVTLYTGPKSKDPQTVKTCDACQAKLDRMAKSGTLSHEEPKTARKTTTRKTTPRKTTAAKTPAKRRTRG